MCPVVHRTLGSGGVRFVARVIFIHHRCHRIDEFSSCGRAHSVAYIMDKITTTPLREPCHSISNWRGRQAAACVGQCTARTRDLNSPLVLFLLQDHTGHHHHTTTTTTKNALKEASPCERSESIALDVVTAVHIFVHGVLVRGIRQGPWRTKAALPRFR